MFPEALYLWLLYDDIWTFHRGVSLRGAMVYEFSTNVGEGIGLLITGAAMWAVAYSTGAGAGIRVRLRRAPTGLVPGSSRTTGRIP